MRTQNLKISNQSQLLNFLEKETDFSIRYRLAFLNTLRALSFELDEVCQVFSVAKSIAYVWIWKWNECGYDGIAHPFHKSDRLGGRPPKLNAADLEQLKTLLSKKSNWLTGEVVSLIEETWGVKLSSAQVARILKKN